MINKLPISIILALFTSVAIEAQNTIQNEDIIVQQLTGEIYIDPSILNKGIHLTEGFQQGKIVLTSGDSIDNLKIRYNCYSDQLIWLHKEFGQIKLDKIYIKDFFLKDVSLSQFSKMTFPSLDEEPHFYQVCYEGKVKLYVLRKVKLHTGYIKNQKHVNIFKPDPQYLLIINQKSFHLKDHRIKSINLLFPELEEKIRKRVKEMNLKDKSENDFIQFIGMNEELLMEGASSTPASQ